LERRIRVPVNNRRDCGCASRIDPHSLRYVPTRRVRTEKAADDTVRIARSLENGGLDVHGADDVTLFKALHTCAYRAGRRMPSGRRSCAERCKWADRWKLVRDHLVERNLGLVYTMVSGFHRYGLDRDELRSEGMLVLVRAVEGFDPWRGYHFSTYACNAIIRALIHVARKATRDRQHFAAEYQEWDRPPFSTDPGPDLHVDRLSLALDENLAELTAREAAVISWRFPRDGGSGRTLAEVGKTVGLSKERVRQIQKTALAKLREVLEGDPNLQ